MAGTAISNAYVTTMLLVTLLVGPVHARLAGEAAFVSCPVIQGSLGLVVRCAAAVPLVWAVITLLGDALVL